MQVAGAIALGAFEVGSHFLRRTKAKGLAKIRQCREGSWRRPGYQQTAAEAHEELSNVKIQSLGLRKKGASQLVENLINHSGMVNGESLYWT